MKLSLIRSSKLKLLMTKASDIVIQDLTARAPEPKPKTLGAKIRLKFKKIKKRKKKTLTLLTKKTKTQRKVRTKIFKDKGYKKSMVINKITGRHN